MRRERRWLRWRRFCIFGGWSNFGRGGEVYFSKGLKGLMCRADICAITLAAAWRAFYLELSMPY